MADTKNQTQIVFTKNQAFGIVLGAILTGIVAGFFGGLRTLNSDHFALIALTNEHIEFKDQVGENLKEIKADVRDIRNALGINVQRPSQSTTTTTTTNDGRGSTNTTTNSETNTSPNVQLTPLPENTGGIVETVKELLP